MRLSIALVLAFSLGSVGGTTGEARDLDAASPMEGPAWLRSSRLGSFGASLPAVTLRLVDVDGCLSSSEADVMSDGVTSLFRTLGLHVDWTRDDPGVAFDKGDEVEVPVIVLRRQPPHHAPDNVLGLVDHVKTPPSPIWVFVDNIRRTLGHGTTTTPTETEGRELAVAVGHVVAHELVHALSPRHPHATSGLMGPSLNRQSLLAERATLDKGWVRSLHEGLAAIAGSSDETRVTRRLPVAP